MTPTIGRIVIFHDLRGDYPAIVLRTAPPTSFLWLGVFSDLGYGFVKDVPEGMEQGEWSWPTRG
jgi:hypothetical protein